MKNNIRDNSCSFVVKTASLANKKSVRGFTLTELLVAIGLLAAVMASSTMIFHYSIEAHRTAMATAQVMHSLRAVTDQLNIQLAGLRKDGWLSVGSGDLSFFTVGDFQSNFRDDIRSNIAWIYFGPANDANDPNNLLLDIKLVTPNHNSTDCLMKSFADYQANADDLLASGRPHYNPDDPYNLLAQRVTDLEIYWTDGSIVSNKIQWEKTIKHWKPSDTDWPKALKFTFTIHDSKGIFKEGKTFEHIVYIGN
ncbi:MAG: hypothetical protein A2Y10_20500 [Planctomycetes bacterium GWF2_41_51]|nr:MAG: hypothetical protein A2Y10_20500 [Planctomycetes bacterium GWF2_41_51]HBG25705.1 hypothetical protein [Phycisphaerales bacterium]